MPLVSSGIVKFRHLKDKLMRKLIVSDAPEEGLEDALDELLKLVEAISDERLEEDDVVEVEAEYEVEGSKIVWVEDSIVVRVYKPVDEVRKRYMEEIESLKSRLGEVAGEISSIRSVISELMTRLEALEKKLQAR